MHDGRAFLTTMRPVRANTFNYFVRRKQLTVAGSYYMYAPAPRRKTRTKTTSRRVSMLGTPFLCRALHWIEHGARSPPMYKPLFRSVVAVAFNEPRGTYIGNLTYTVCSCPPATTEAAFTRLPSISISRYLPRNLTRRSYFRIYLSPSLLPLFILPPRNSLDCCVRHWIPNTLILFSFHNGLSLLRLLNNVV